MLMIWLGVLVVMVVVEMATVGLVSIWFALGALAALISALFNAPLWMQFMWFIVISGAALAFTRPLAVKYLNSRRSATNADRVLEMTGVVRDGIDNLAGQGSVFIGGKLWTARSESGVPIASGVRVRAVRIEGVKLIVHPAAADEEAVL